MNVKLSFIYEMVCGLKMFGARGPVGHIGQSTEILSTTKLKAARMLNVNGNDSRGRISAEKLTRIESITPWRAF
jgi:hypothetical protein